MGLGQRKSAGHDVLEAAMGCLHALSKATVEDDVRNQLLGRIFQSFGDVHKNVHNGQRQMGSHNETWDYEHAHGDYEILPMVQQKNQQRRSTEEVKISSLFASLSEAVSQGALDVKDFFSVVALMEESVLRNTWKDGNHGNLEILHDKKHENGKKGSSLEKGKHEVSLVHDLSRSFWRRNVVANEDGQTHVHGEEEQKSISRSFESSNGAKERETPFCPLDNRQPVNALVVAPQGALIHENSSQAAASDPQRSLSANPPCMAAVNAHSTSNTLPLISTPSHLFDRPPSNFDATVSGNLEKGGDMKDNHVTPDLPPHCMAECGTSSKGLIGKSMPKPLSFLEAAKRNVHTPLDGIPHQNQNKEGKTSPTPCSASNNSHIFKIDQRVFNKRMELCRFSILGKLTLAKGDEPWTWSKLKGKLDAIWKLNSQWRLISIGKGFFHIILTNQEEFDRVWSKEVLLLNPGVLRLQCWKFGFNPSVEKSTKAQVWFRIFQLPWCLWDTSVILGIASMIGQPLRIDKQTLEGSFGHYARVLIEVDLAKSIMSSVLVDCNEHVLEVQITPESMPPFCMGCNAIGHSVTECRRSLKPETTSNPIKSDRSQLTSGNKRDHKDFRMDSTIGASTSKRNAQHAEWRRKKVHVLDNGNIHSVRKTNMNHEIVETITDFSAQGGSRSPIAKRTDALVISNQFAVLEEESEAVELVVSATPMNHELEGKSGVEDEGYAHFIEDGIDIQKVPDRWSDLIDDEDTIVDDHLNQGTNTYSMEASPNIKDSSSSTSGFRAKMHGDCIWLNHDDDSKYDRDMCVEIERYKNSAKATRNFIANLPKKEKKVKIAFRHPQGKVGSPKE